MKATRTIRKIGHSYWVSVPPIILDNLGLGVGDEVVVLFRRKVSKKGK